MSILDDLIAELCPEGVEFKTLESCVRKPRSIRWSESTEEFQYVDLSSVDRVTHTIADTSAITAEDAPSRAQQIIERGDAIFGTTRPMLKRYAVIPIEYDGQICSTGFCVLRPNTDVLLTNYLFHTLGTARFYEHVEANERGASYPAIPDHLVKRFRIPVPPLEVQREIMEVLDSFRALQAELEAELEARGRQYEHYRDSLLALPDQRTATLGELGSLYAGLAGKSKADFSGGNARYVSYMNVFRNLATETAPYDFVTVAPGEAQNHVRYGDVLFTSSSETATEGGMSSAVTATPTEPLYLNRFCFGFRPKRLGELDPSFAKHLFRSSAVRRQIIRTANGVTRINISKARFREIEIPVPPPDQQKYLADVLDGFETLVNDRSIGLPAELDARRRQYEHYRDRLLTFLEAA